MRARRSSVRHLNKELEMIIYDGAMCGVVGCLTAQKNGTCRKMKQRVSFRIGPGYVLIGSTEYVLLLNGGLVHESGVTIEKLSEEDRRSQEAVRPNECRGKSLPPSPNAAGHV